MQALKPGWKRVKFGEVVRLCRETCKDPAGEGIERYVGLEHIEPGDLRVRSWGDVADGTTFTNRVRPGQVLFGKRRAYQRKVAVADFDAVCSGDIYVFESANPTRLLPELLPFLCQTDAFFDHAVGTSAGSLSPRTNWTSLAEYELALPPLEEQRKLVHVLQALTEVEDCVRTSILASRFLRDSLVVQRFVGHAEEVLRPLCDLCEEITVGIVVKPADLYVAAGEGVPALIMNNVQRGRIDTISILNISHHGHAAHAKSALRAGDVVAVRSSGSIGRTGDAAVVPPSLHGANCIDLLIVRPKRILRPEFLCEYLNAPTTRADLIGRSSGTMQKHLNVGALKRLRLPSIPDADQAAFIEGLSVVDSAISSLERRWGAVQSQRRIVISGLGDRCR